ncbi:hypothetical protein Tco_0839094 [Tanacetum coccineum]|uniref:Uncharacterized protein n=1 Tax=Tanacetum coccineum TaxID=301880 RepID=A0ABQ5ASU9_9ASTR
MRTDELHKFSDGTLNHVRTTLNDIATRIQMGYFPKRRWSPQDKRRARVMISAIDRKLRDRRLMRSLEKFVGGRPLAARKDHMIYHIFTLRVLRNYLVIWPEHPSDIITMKMEILLEQPSNKLMGVKEFQRSLCHSDTERLSRSDEVLKLKNFKKDATLKLFKSTNQERYEHVGPKVTSLQDGETRLCLVDDLKNIRVILLTVKMEILLEPTSNKLMVGRSSWIRRILKDGGEVKEFQRSFRHSDTERLSRSDEVLKLKNFKKDEAILKLFKKTYQERYEHVGPEVTRSLEGKDYKMATKDYAWLMILKSSKDYIQVKNKIQAKA